MQLVHLINGPNLNLLGHPAMRIYGDITLAAIEQRCATLAPTLDLQLVCRQSNHEGQIIDWIQDSLIKEAAVVINAGALAFSSILLVESIKLLRKPVIEVHMSNTHAREAIYKNSLLSPNVAAVLVGLGPNVYEAGLRAVSDLVRTRAS